jgi:hypothetical protein
MTYRTTVFLASIFSALFLTPAFAMAQGADATVYTAGQESVRICLPTTGSYTPEVCEANFDPVGLCESDEEVEFDHCSTFSDAPLCSIDGQRGQECACYYFCRKPAISPGPLFAFSHVNSRGQTDYSPASEVQASALGGVQAGEAEVTENERTGLLFLKGK